MNSLSASEVKSIEAGLSTVKKLSPANKVARPAISVVKTVATSAPSTISKPKTTVSPIKPVTSPKGVPFDPLKDQAEATKTVALNPLTDPETEKKSNKKIIIIVAVIAAVVIGIMIFRKLRKNAR